MTTSSNLPRLPLVDLTSHYLVHLDGIDAENQFRHLQGEPLMSYPSFEEFVDLCREKGSSAGIKECIEALEFDSSYRVLDEDYCDEVDLKWLLPVAAVGIISDDDDYCDGGAEGSKWVTAHGSFAFVSLSTH